MLIQVPVGHKSDVVAIVLFIPPSQAIVLFIPGLAASRGAATLKRASCLMKARVMHHSLMKA